MSWTYLSTAPLSSDRSFIRFRLGDTSSGDILLHDEEIDGLLATYGSRYTAAAEGARSIAAKLGRRVDKTAGRLSLRQSQAAEFYTKLADRLEREAVVSGGGGIYAGGLSVAESEADRQDPDLVQPSFYRDQFTYPGTAADSSEASG